MTEKYIDLEQQIIDAPDGATDSVCSCYDLGVEAALEYLDRNPDQVPGRTITESEFISQFGDFFSDKRPSLDGIRARLSTLGHPVVPGP